jgi:hypothetical protein
MGRRGLLMIWADIRRNAIRVHVAPRVERDFAQARKAP